MSFKDNANLVIFTHLDCSTCGNKDIKQYIPPGITYGDYVHDELKLICSCGNKYNCKPIFGVSTDWKGFDNGNGNGNGNGNDNHESERKSKSKSQSQEGEEKKKKPIAINKYSGNGRLPLHESVVIGLETKFVNVLTKDKKIAYELFDNIKGGSETFIPKGTINDNKPAILYIH